MTSNPQWWREFEAEEAKRMERRENARATLDEARVRATTHDGEKLRKLLNRLDHVVALWDADDPMGAYQVLVQSIRDARE